MKKQLKKNTILYNLQRYRNWYLNLNFMLIPTVFYFYFFLYIIKISGRIQNKRNVCCLWQLISISSNENKMFKRKILCIIFLRYKIFADYSYRYRDTWYIPVTHIPAYISLNLCFSISIGNYRRVVLMLIQCKNKKYFFIVYF